MAKRFSRYAITPQKLIRWSEDGRGTGTGSDYLSWLTVHDSSSKGVRIRVWGHKTNRVHHVLSFLEYLNFTDIINRPEVTDVREQFPRPLELTLRIAKELGYEHPRDPRTKCQIVMTTDLVSTWKSGPFKTLAQYVKPSDEVTGDRNEEKAEIEEKSWSESPATRFEKVTEKDVSLPFINNMRWLRAAVRRRYLEGIQHHVNSVESDLRPLVESRAGPIWELAHSCDQKRLLEPGTSLSIIKWLLAHHWWESDLRQPINPHQALHVTRFAYVRQ